MYIIIILCAMQCETVAVTMVTAPTVATTIPAIITTPLNIIVIKV